MTADNSTPKTPSVHGLQKDAQGRIYEKLDILEKDISQQADHEQHYPEIEKLFNGFRADLKEIIKIISDETQKAIEIAAPPTAEKQQKVVPPAVAEYYFWLKAMPNQLPEFMATKEGDAPLFQNPFIGWEVKDTHKAVHQGVKFLAEISLPFDAQDSFSLSHEASWGFYYFLETMDKAMSFEVEHRKGGGKTTGDFYYHTV